MKVSYFASDSGFIAVTDKSPKDFAGVLFIGKGGLTLTTITEQVYAPADVKKLQPVPKDGMTDEWITALGFEKPTKKPAPKPVKPAPEPAPEYVDWPVFDEAGEELLDLAPLRRGWPLPPAAPVSPNHGRDWAVHLGYALGAIGLLIYFFWQYL